MTSPGRSRPSRPSMIGGLFITAVMAGLTAALLGGGSWELVQRQTGTRAHATVSSCERMGFVKGDYRVHCEGTWRVGGSLADGGRLVVGTINGVDRGDVGKTVEVTISGDTAYSRGLALPLVLIGLGLLPAAGLVLVVRGLFQRRTNPVRPDGPPPGGPAGSADPRPS